MSDKRGTRRQLLRDKRVLAVVVLLLAVVLVASVVLTFASFTSSSSNKGSSVSAGAVEFELSKGGAPLADGAPIVDTSHLHPGDTKQADVTITNKQSPANFTLRFTGITGALAAVLKLTVTVPGQTGYNGDLTGVTAQQPLALGQLDKNGTRTVSVTFTWPAAQNGAALQAQSVPLVLNWDAKS